MNHKERSSDPRWKLHCIPLSEVQETLRTSANFSVMEDMALVPLITPLLPTLQSDVSYLQACAHICHPFCLMSLCWGDNHPSQKPRLWHLWLPSPIKSGIPPLIALISSYRKCFSLATIINSVKTGMMSSSRLSFFPWRQRKLQGKVSGAQKIFVG